jgi:restriction system protein
MRRHRKHLLDEMVQLPWWVSVVAAIAAFLALRFLVPLVLSGGRVGVGGGKVSSIFAPLVAFLLLFPAPFAYWNSRKRRHLLDSQQDLSTIRTLHWKEFERMIGEAFRRQGYAVEEQGGSAPDGGIDLVLRKDGEIVIVQCKHWKARQVGVTIVRELLGVMVAARADRGILVSSGYFTEEAINFSRDQSIDLIDGDSLVRLLPEMDEAARREPYLAKSEMARSARPCPLCGSEMVRRTAKRGPASGSVFCGCSQYPRCRGTTPI